VVADAPLAAFQPLLLLLLFVCHGQSTSWVAGLVRRPVDE
jgi:hypothetical protein